MRTISTSFLFLILACSTSPKRDWAAELAQCRLVSKTIDDLTHCLAIDRNWPAESASAMAERFHAPIAHHHLNDLRQCYAGLPLTGDSNLAQATIERCLANEHKWQPAPASLAAARYSLFMTTVQLASMQGGSRGLERLQPIAQCGATSDEAIALALDADYRILGPFCDNAADRQSWVHALDLINQVDRCYSEFADGNCVSLRDSVLLGAGFTKTQDGELLLPGYHP